MTRLTADLMNVYRGLLRKELSVIEAEPNHAYERKSIHLVVKQPYLKVVERLKAQRLLQDNVSTRSGLIQVKETVLGKKLKVTNYSALRDEVGKM